MTTRERTESFTTDGPVRAKLATKSGGINVRTHDSTTIEVTLRAAGSGRDAALENAVVRFDASSHELEVRTVGVEPLDSLASLKDLMKGAWLDFGRSDLDVTVTLPAGSSLDVRTASGDTKLGGELGDVTAQTASGDVAIVNSAASLDVKTASGDVDANTVKGTLRCRSASGDVRCSAAGSVSEVITASGDVHMQGRSAGEVSVRAVSGDVGLAVRKGLAVDVNGTTVSGDLTSAIALDEYGDDAAPDETVVVRVQTVSGDVRIRRAS